MSPRENNKKMNKEIPFILKYNEPANHDVTKEFEDMMDSMNSSPSKILRNVNDDWERWSLPIGNGYFGCNIFGRTDTEKFVISEKTLCTAYIRKSTEVHLTGGLNTFCNLYLDFNHKYDMVKDYIRSLDIMTGICKTEYTYEGVKYTVSSVASYVDNLLIINIECSEKGKLNFQVRPKIPYIQEYLIEKGDRCGKSGDVKSKIVNNIGEIELSGKMEYYDTDFCGLFRVYKNGGNIQSENDIDGNGVINVNDADSSLIILSLGTDYELEEEIFLAPDKEKPTFYRDYTYTYNKVKKNLDKALRIIKCHNTREDFEILKKRHLNDFSSIMNRVSLDLDFDKSDYDKMTDVLLTEYKEGKTSKYLEALYFQYGRYLLLSSSREGTLPAHLQGTWNKYRQPMWSSAYFHNINVQMNYWPAFSTNIGETFKAYVEYFKAFLPSAKTYANEYVEKDNNSTFGKDGGNGFVIGTACFPYRVTGNKSAGNIGFTTQMFWEYYQFTRDKEILTNLVFPILCEAARYITKCVKKDESGKYLVMVCDSPEQYVDGEWYYTSGTTYAQTFAYLNNYHALVCAKELGIGNEDLDKYPILKTILEQIDEYDPVIVGYSGQIKEFREEKYYGDLGEYTHRHISNLVGLYPGNLINGETPAWLDASKVTLTERGDIATGWGVAHRLNLWARTKDGNRTYKLLNQLLLRNTAPNLWDLHPPFQIDGNLGGCSGIAEMLIQSHEHYIDIIPSIPDYWATGGFKGLKARGNFDISASWKNGEIEEVKVFSNMGDKVTLNLLPTINTCVTNSLGENIKYESNNGMISFDTLKGIEYSITGIERRKTKKRVENAHISYKDSKSIKISWEKANAKEYIIKKAVASDKDYTFIAKTNDNYFEYTFDEKEKNMRMTISISYLDEYNIESDRSLIYIVPIN